jgi:DNA replication and repair protein RecF
MAETGLHIEQIKLNHYKNYDFSAFEFCSRLNLIVGNNGKGKTNLLDAIYYSCLTKSYHTSSDQLVLNFDRDYFRIETLFSLNTDNQLLEVKYIKQDKKEIKLNKARVEKLSSFIGMFPCVIITPDDNQLILGSSEVRRKFLDSSIAQYSTDYLANLLLYNKLLTQRNALLKSFYENRSFDQHLLDVYNEKLIPCGIFIFEQRKRFLEKFIEVFKTVYHQIFEGNETVSITYISELLSQ